jgi:hypothetical protein
VSFEGDLKDFELKFDKASDDFIQGVEVSLFNAVILDSPVKIGLFMGNWQTSVANPAVGVTSQLDPSGSATIARMQSFVKALKGGRITFLANNLPYAQRLEYGYSRKAPGGMVRKNVIRFQRIVDEQAGKHKL